jgi:hypothetical protein
VTYRIQPSTGLRIVCVFGFLLFAAVIVLFMIARFASSSSSDDWSWYPWLLPVQVVLAAGCALFVFAGGWLAITPDGVDARQLGQTAMLRWEHIDSVEPGHAYNTLTSHHPRHLPSQVERPRPAAAAAELGHGDRPGATRSRDTPGCRRALRKPDRHLAQVRTGDSQDSLVQANITRRPAVPFAHPVRVGVGQQDREGTGPGSGRHHQVHD